MANLTAAITLLRNKGFTQSAYEFDAAYDRNDMGNRDYIGPADLSSQKYSDDIIIGGTAAERLRGGEGNDILIGGAGRDTLDGGNGSDTASYATATGGVTASLAATATNTGDAAGDVYSSIENLMGSEFADRLTGDNGNNVLTGLNGNDTLSGGIGNDTLYADGGTDQLNGEAGDDYLYAGEGNDTLNGGDNNDQLVAQGGDTLNGDAGNDHLYAGTFSVASLTADTMNGGSGDDFFYGNLGSAGQGTWTYNGGSGSDTFIAGLNREAITGGNETGAIDKLSYASTVNAVSLNMQMGTGSGGHAQGDTFTGIEWVVGSGGNDTIVGSTRQEIIEGGRGNDTLTGGGESDLFAYNVAEQVMNIEGTIIRSRANIGNDVITDFDAKSSPTDTVYDLLYFQNMTQQQFDAMSVVQVGADTVITSDTFTGSITLRNFDADMWMQF